MRICIVSGHTVRRGALGLVCAAAGMLLLRFPTAAANGVSRGLAVCGKQLIPSLFPFLVLTGFLIKSGLAEDAIRAVSRRIPPLRRCGGALTVVILSLLGGYPMGACAVVAMTRQGLFTPQDARHLLRTSVHAAPAFIIGGVGAGMLGSVQAGLLLWAAHWLASWLLWPLWNPLRVRRVAAPSPPLPLSRAVTDSLHDACATLLSMAGTVLAACTVLSLIDALGGAHLTAPWIRALIALPLEVSTGCLESAACGVHAPFFLGFALGFSGLAVCGQIAAVSAAYALVDRGFFAARLLHGLLGGCLSLVLFRLFEPSYGAVPTVAAWSRETVDTASGAAGTVLLMLTAVLFLISLPSAPRKTA